MAENNRTTAELTEPDVHENTDAAAEAPNPPPSMEAEPEAESDTGRMLREAINKVMAQINHHQREAKKHLQRAEELRKDLRESFAFLQDQKSKEKPGATDKKTVGPVTKEKAEEAAETARPARSKPKKKRS